MAEIIKLFREGNSPSSGGSLYRDLTEKFKQYFVPEQGQHYNLKQLKFSCNSAWVKCGGSVYEKKITYTTSLELSEDGGSTWNPIHIKAKNADGTYIDEPGAAITGKSTSIAKGDGSSYFDSSCIKVATLDYENAYENVYSMMTGTDKEKVRIRLKVILSDNSSAGNAYFRYTNQTFYADFYGANDTVLDTPDPSEKSLVINSCNLQFSLRRPINEETNQITGIQGKYSYSLDLDIYPISTTVALYHKKEGNGIKYSNTKDDDNYKIYSYNCKMITGIEVSYKIYGNNGSSEQEISKEFAINDCSYDSDYVFKKTISESFDYKDLDIDNETTEAKLIITKIKLTDEYGSKDFEFNSLESDTSKFNEKVIPFNISSSGHTVSIGKYSEDVDFRRFDRGNEIYREAEGKFELNWPISFSENAIIKRDSNDYIDDEIESETTQYDFGILNTNYVEPALDAAYGYPGLKLKTNGSMVEFNGSLRAKKVITCSTGDQSLKICEIPHIFLPDHNIVQLCQGSGAYIWRLIIKGLYDNNPGEVTISRNRSGGSYTNFVEGSSIAFHVTWFKTPAIEINRKLHGYK